jgi:hypothetical protein
MTKIIFNYKIKSEKVYGLWIIWRLEPINFCLNVLHTPVMKNRGMKYHFSGIHTTLKIPL